MRGMNLPEIQRRPSRAVDVGGVTIGGGAPVSVQSMTNTLTADAEATLAQVGALADAGADLVRVAVPTSLDTAALDRIVAESPVPIIADVHFHFQRALEAIAAGAAKIRLNPGNIADRDQVRRVIDAAGAAGVAIRIGVNEGSVVTRADGAQRQADLARPLAELMVDKLAEYVAIFTEAGFENLVLAAKSHDAVTCVAAARLIADRWDYPMHLGVTHAGPPETAAIRSAAAIGALLCEGIGDTVRISYAGDPTTEVRAAVELLCSLRLRDRHGIGDGQHSFPVDELPERLAIEVLHDDVVHSVRCGAHVEDRTDVPVPDHGGDPHPVMKTRGSAAKTDVGRLLVTDMVDAQRIRIRVGVTVNNIGSGPFAFKVSGNPGQAQRRHDVGHSGNIPTGCLLAIAEGMDQEDPLRIKSGRTITHLSPPLVDQKELRR